MSKILTNNQYYSQIANVIREQNGTNNTYKPAQMVSALKDLFYEEVEGVPPLNFQGIGEDLLDYRIEGASGGVGERTKNFINITVSTSNYQGVQITINKDKSITLYGTASNNAWITIQTNNILDVGQYILTGAVNNVLLRYQKNVAGYGYDDIGEGRNINITEKITTGIINLRIVENVFYDNVTIYPMIRLATEDNTYEPYGYKVPVMVEGKNLLQNTATSQTKNGVTFTVNEDGSVTCNGTASDDAWFVVNRSFDLYAPEGRIASIGNNGSTSTFYMNISYFGNVTTSRNYSRTAHQNVYVQLVIAAGYTCDNLTFYPMIRKADIEDDTYEPYHEPTITNIYLNNAISEGESVSLSDTNTNIPTIRGTNVLTVDTTVQPSNVYVKSRKESQYETAMRENYEEVQAQLDVLESGGE